MSYKEWIDLIGRKHMEWTNEEGLRDRVGAPAYIKHYTNGLIEIEQFRFNGELHRTDGPAVNYYHENGLIDVKEFYSKGQMHRDNGAAYIQHDDCGKVTYEEFWLDGNFIGHESPGFWSFWETLSEKQKEDLNILKTMFRYV